MPPKMTHSSSTKHAIGLQDFTIDLAMDEQLSDDSAADFELSAYFFFIHNVEHSFHSCANNFFH